MSATELTSDEYRILDELPDGANTVEVEAHCWVQEGHPGQHMTLGQACGAEDVEWWLRWGDEGRDLAAVEMCPEADPASADLCLLPAGHWGRHSYGLE
ncbi:hypothetical protein AB0395_48210 [Streptosporangium sp. NPDC051023]|uniref:hypothetical protein n=1 Tax=Streptosporangium sp. NPDC051023 TaxID=3155410 RepID=UPI00344D95A2